MIGNGAPNPDPVAVANIGADGIVLVVGQESFRAAVVSPRKAVAVVLEAVAEVLPHTGLVGSVCGVGDSAGFCGFVDRGG